MKITNWSKKYNVTVVCIKNMNAPFEQIHIQNMEDTPTISILIQKHPHKGKQTQKLKLNKCKRCI